jgi:hypothetical protein
MTHEKLICKKIFSCNKRKSLQSFVSFAFWSICLAQCKRQKVRPAETEDSVVLRLSVEQFGAPRPLNYANYTLPGPEITTNLVESGDTNKLDDFVTENTVDDQFGNYTLKYKRSLLCLS